MAASSPECDSTLRRSPTFAQPEFTLPVATRPRKASRSTMATIMVNGSAGWPWGGAMWATMASSKGATVRGGLDGRWGGGSVVAQPCAYQAQFHFLDCRDCHALHVEELLPCQAGKRPAIADSAGAFHMSQSCRANWLLHLICRLSSSNEAIGYCTFVEPVNPCCA